MPPDHPATDEFTCISPSTDSVARDLIVTENITVDSVIDATGDWFVPSGSEKPEHVADMREVEERLRATADALLVGRLTFEAFRGYWPRQTDDTTGVTEYLNRVDKYVVSSTLEAPGWEGTTVLRGDVADEVAELKDRPGGEIVTTGSITLVHALRRAGLVDEYRLFVYPVVLGEGRRLFDGPGDRHELELVETHPFTSGVVLLRYRASGR
jgi:dihydrofolate reductase